MGTSEVALDYNKIASTGFSSLAAYAGTAGPGAHFIASFAAGPVGAAVGGIIAGIAVASQYIGQGRREADVIVPLQNQYAAVLDAANDAMTSNPGLTAAELQNLAQVVADGYGQFEQFTRDPRFKDGRASVQARNTIRPFVDGRNDNGDVVDANGGTLGRIERRISEVSGVGGLLTSAAAGGGGLLLLVGGGLVLLKILKII